ncbi:hypothetical protein AB0M97_11090 [Streptomyces sp. NPDC051207]|uniref:hypothetical protein n=1 Tax=Streptomyces sp. NPDC051207 TaxID=3154641 RepID=UPI003444A39C
MIRRSTLPAAAGGTFLGSGPATGTAHADATIGVTPSAAYGTREGWAPPWPGGAGSRGTSGPA